MATTLQEELIRLRVRFDGAEIRKGMRDLEELNSTLDKTNKSGTAAGGKRGGYGSGYGVLMLSQALEDAQYGMSAVVNNIPLLIMAMGGGAGLAGAVSMAAVGLNQLNNHQAEIFGANAQTRMNEWGANFRRTIVNTVAGYSGGFLAPITKADEKAAAREKELWAEIANTNKENIEFIKGIRGKGSKELGDAFKDSLTEHSGGAEVLDLIVNGIATKDKLDDVATNKLRENIARILANAVKGSPLDIKEALNYLRQSGWGNVADQIVRELIPARGENAQRIARERLAELNRGLGEVWGDFLPGLPWANAKDRAKNAATMQGGMEAAGVDEHVQQQIAEYFRSNSGRALLKYVPQILPILSEAGLNQREAWEALLRIGKRVESGQTWPAAVQATLNEAMKGGQQQELAALSMTAGDEATLEGAGMLGIDLMGQGENSRFMGRGRRPTRKNRERIGGPAMEQAGRGGAAGAGADGAAGGNGNPGKRSRRGPAGFGAGRRMIAISPLDRRTPKKRDLANKAEIAGLEANLRNGGGLNRVKPRKPQVLATLPDGRQMTRPQKTMGQALQGKRQDDANRRAEYQAQRQQIDNALAELDEMQAEMRRQYLSHKMDQQNFDRKMYPKYFEDKPERTEDDFAAEWDQMHGQQFEDYRRQRSFGRSGFPFMPRPDQQQDEQEATPDAEFNGWNTTGNDQAAGEQLQFNGEMMAALRNIESGADPVAEAIAQQREELRSITAQTYQRMGSP